MGDLHLASGAFHTLSQSGKAIALHDGAARCFAVVGDLRCADAASFGDFDSHGLAFRVTDAVCHTRTGGSGDQSLHRLILRDIAVQFQINAHLRGLPVYVLKSVRHTGAVMGKAAHRETQRFKLFVKIVPHAAPCHLREGNQARSDVIVDTHFQIQRFLFPDTAALAV